MDNGKRCSVDGCERAHGSKGYCRMHYERVRRFGDTELHGAGRKPQDPVTRFMAKVHPNPVTGCWEWQGHVAASGYGTFRIDSGRRGPAHRRGWELLRGPIDPGLQLDHLCRVRHCVNPDHLEPVPPRVNLARSTAWTGPNSEAAKTHCVNGHGFTPENTHVTPAGHRQCRACHRERARASRLARS